MTVHVTLTGIISTPPDITETDGALRVRFTLVHSPGDPQVDDVALPCVLYDGDASRSDAEDFLRPGARIRATGRLHLPDRPSGRFVLEITDLEEDHEVAVPQPETAMDVYDVDGHTVVTCEQPDGTRLLHVIARTGASAVARSERELSLAIAWLIRRT
jgi:hypothetical protein